MKGINKTLQKAYTLQATTIIKNWWLIDFENEGEPQDMKVAWGIVEEDTSARWAPGACCCTSPVIEEREQEGELYAITNNSMYQLTGTGERMIIEVFASKEI